MKKNLTLLLLLMCIGLSAQPPGWSYNQPISVTNPNSVAAVDYQLKITVNTQSLISLGQMLSNGNDIRFGTTCTGTSFLNYWIEAGLNTPTTAIWVKIPLIAANTTSVIYMFYGNSGAAAMSAIQGTFRGPNSATDSVSGGTSGGLLVCQRGFRFAPTQNILVTSFGKNEPSGTTRYVTLFNYSTQAILSQTQVAGPAATYTYGPIPSPLWLTSGTQYVLQIYGLATDGYYYGPSTQIGQHLTYYEMQYSNGGTQNTFPNSTLANYHYGYGDFLYYICSTLAITPTYSMVSTGSITTSGPVAAVCSGNSTTLQANVQGATTYSWNTGATTATLAVSPTSNTSYSVTVVNSVGCSVFGVITVSVSTGPPVISVNSSTNQTCFGKTVTLTATGALSYTWSNGVVNGVSFMPSVTNIYTVTGANGCGTASAAISVSVDPLPVTAATTQSILCQANTTTLMAVGGTSYTWAPGNQTVSTIVIAPTVSTIYTVTASDGTCSGTATLSIVTKPNPTITISASSATSCAGDPVTLTATGADTYVWTPAVITGSTGIVNPTVPSSYMVAGTNSVGCTTTANQVINAKAVPVLNASASPTLVCVNGTATLTATGNSNIYSWSTGATAGQTTVSPVSSSSYIITGTLNSTGCTTTKTVSVDVFEPVLSVGPETTVCPGAAVTLTTSPATGHQWSTGGNFSFVVVAPTSATMYTVSAMTSSNNVICPATGSVNIGLFSKPTVTAATTRTAICRGEKISLDASGATTYTWSNNNNDATITFSSNLATTHNYSVVGTDANGCRDTAKIQIRVSSCNALEENDNPVSIKIFPNPNRGTFTIETEDDAELELVNIQGQLIQHISLNNENRRRINIESLANGTYFITGIKNNQQFSSKIVVGD